MFHGCAEARLLTNASFTGYYKRICVNGTRTAPRRLVPGFWLAWVENMCQLVPGLKEGYLHNRYAGAVGRVQHAQPRALGGVIRCDHGEAYVAIKSWRVDGRGDASDLYLVSEYRPESGVRCSKRLAGYFQPNQLSANSISLDALERSLTDKFRFHVQVNEPTKAQLEWIGIHIHVRPVRQHCGLDASDRRRMACTKAKGFPGIHQSLP